MNKFTERLSQLMIEKRELTSLRDIALMTGISPATLHRIENGRIPSLGTFVVLCRWLEVNPSDLLKLIEE